MSKRLQPLDKISGKAFLVEVVEVIWAKIMVIGSGG